MEIKPLKEYLSMGERAIKDVLLIPKLRKIKKQAELKGIELDEQIASLELDIEESLTRADYVDFEKLIDNLDKLKLMQRRKKQYSDIIAKLFPPKQ